VYSFIVSLSTLQPAVALFKLTWALERPKIAWDGDTMFELPAPSFAMRNAIIIAVVYIVPGILSALQYLTKLVYRLRGLHGFLTHDVMSMSLLIVLVASKPYLDSFVMVEYRYTVPYPDADDLVRGYFYFITDDAVTMGLVMTVAPIMLLLETVESRGAPLLMRLTGGRPKFQRLVERLDIVLQLTKAIPWALLYVVALLMALSRNYEHPYYALHLCYLVIFFLHRFLTTLPTWCSSVANVWKIVCSAVSTYWK